MAKKNSSGVSVKVSTTPSGKPIPGRETTAPAVKPLVKATKTDKLAKPTPVNATPAGSKPAKDKAAKKLQTAVDNAFKAGTDKAADKAGAKEEKAKRKGNPDALAKAREANAAKQRDKLAEEYKALGVPNQPDTDARPLHEQFVQDPAFLGSAISTDKVYVAPEDARAAHADADGIADMARRIIAAGGIVSPISVRKESGGKRYKVVFGRRRFLAAQLLKLPTVPCVFFEGDDKAELAAAAGENSGRVELNNVDKATQAESYLRVFAPEAQERKGKGKKAGHSNPNAGRALHLAATQVGWSYNTLSKALYVKRHGSDKLLSAFAKGMKVDRACNFAKLDPDAQARAAADQFKGKPEDYATPPGVDAVTGNADDGTIPVGDNLTPVVAKLVERDAWNRPVPDRDVALAMTRSAYVIDGLLKEIEDARHKLRGVQSRIGKLYDSKPADAAAAFFGVHLDQRKPTSRDPSTVQIKAIEDVLEAIKSKIIPRIESVRLTAVCSNCEGNPDIDCEACVGLGCLDTKAVDQNGIWIAPEGTDDDDSGEEDDDDSGDE